MGEKVRMTASLPGPAGEAHGPVRRSKSDAGGRRATVRHVVPLAGEGAMQHRGAGLMVRAGGGGCGPESCCRMARARLRLSEMRWSRAGERGGAPGKSDGSGDGDGGERGGWKREDDAFGVTGEGGSGDAGSARGELAPLPLAPLPRALPDGVLPAPLEAPFAGACLPLARLPFPFDGGGVGGEEGTGCGVSRKASVMRISRSRSGRDMKADMRTSCTSASI